VALTVETTEHVILFCYYCSNSMQRHELMCWFQKWTGKRLCDLSADQWSYLLDELQRHVQLQHIIDEVGLKACGKPQK